MDSSYRSLRALMYMSGSYPYTIHDDVVLQSYSRRPGKLGGELDEIVLGQRNGGEEI